MKNWNMKAIRNANRAIAAPVIRSACFLKKFISPPEKTELIVLIIQCRNMQISDYDTTFSAENQPFLKNRVQTSP